MSHGKQFTLFTHAISPNGWYVIFCPSVTGAHSDGYHRKVAFVLNELGLSYEPRYLDWFTEIKGSEHTKYNPNGRIPTLIDHKNGDFVVW